jgi:8-oxo-dGTP diphosphatase
MWTLSSSETPPMTQDPRLHPPRPILAASVAVMREGRVLLAARGRDPLRGVFSLPGGAVEVGETLVEAARREVGEETGLAIGAPDFLTHEELILRDGYGRVERHFVICVFTAAWAGGEPQVSEEAVEFVWADPFERTSLPVTPGLWDLLATLRTRLG